MIQDPGTRTDIVYRAGLLLVCSNVFMTFAWYAHLRNLAGRPWWIAALVSWGIALFEYLLQVPAIGSATPCSPWHSSRSSRR